MPPPPPPPSRNRPSTAIPSKRREVDIDSSTMPDNPSIYLIRHAEKPPKLPDGDDANGLSAQGLTRAQGLRKVFGADSQYDIRYIIAEKAKKDGTRTRPLETVAPLANDLGIDVDTSIDRDDFKDAAKLALYYISKNEGNVLVCWEHGILGDIVNRIVKLMDGDSKRKTSKEEKVEYPDDRFDVIWRIGGEGKVEWVGSEGVEGLDEGWVGDSGEVGWREGEDENKKGKGKQDDGGEKEGKGGGRKKK